MADKIYETGDDNRRVQVKGTGCLILIWAGAILLLAICAGGAARVWGLI